MNCDFTLWQALGYAVLGIVSYELGGFIYRIAFRKRFIRWLERRYGP